MLKLIHLVLKKKLNLKMIYIYTINTKLANYRIKITVRSHNYKRLEIINGDPVLNNKIDIIC